MSDIICLINIPDAHAELGLDQSAMVIGSNLHSKQGQTLEKNEFSIRWSGFPTSHCGIHQVHSNGGDWIVAMDGEIFFTTQACANASGIPWNSLESVKLAEVIIQMYLEQELKFLNYLKGRFNLVLYNEAKHLTLIANDRYGFKPLYYIPLEDGWVFASSLSSFIKGTTINVEVDSLTLLEAAFINFPLGDKTILKNVRRFAPASCWEIRAGEVQRKKYWNPLSLLEGAPLGMQESLEEGSSLFKQVVNDLTEDVDQIGLTLTAGFDGRTILSVLDRQRINVRAFTFGKRDCEESRIARKVAAKASVGYEQVELEQEFQEAFESYAKRTVRLSDGQATFLRAHYLYAFERQASSSKVFMTGIGGSELIRAIHNIGDMYHQNLAAMIAGPNPAQSISDTLENTSSIGLINRDLFGDQRKNLYDSLVENLVTPYSGLSKNERFFLFNLCEVLPKYFGSELRLEDDVCVVRPPYLDHDFISIIARSPFAAIYNSPFVDSPVARRKGQLFYSYTINRYDAPLGYLLTDRGYPPVYNLLPMSYFLIAPAYLGARLARRINPHEHIDALDMGRWTEGLFQQVLFQGDLRNHAFIDQASVKKALSSSPRSSTMLRDLAYVASHVLWREEMGLE